MTDDPDVWARMRERARATNLARTDQIEPALAHGAPREVVETGRAVAHSVAGAAGTFGYDEASRLAREIELALEDSLDRPGPAAAGLSDVLDTLRGELRPDSS